MYLKDLNDIILLERNRAYLKMSSLLHRGLSTHTTNHTYLTIRCKDMATTLQWLDTLHTYIQHLISIQGTQASLNKQNVTNIDLHYRGFVALHCKHHTDGMIEAMTPEWIRMYSGITYIQHK